MLIFLAIALAGGKITPLDTKRPVLDAVKDECDLFHYGELCTLYPASNIVDMYPDLNNEVKCLCLCLNVYVYVYVKCLCLNVYIKC